MANIVLFQERPGLIASTHLTVGAAVGILSYRFLFKSNSVSGVAGAFIVGIISHFLLDIIPHADNEWYRLGGSDSFLSVILFMELGLSFLLVYLCGTSGLNRNYQNGYLLAGMVGGALPDVPHVVMSFLKINWRFLQAADRINAFFHTSFHANSLWQGVLPQVIIIVLSLALLYYFKSGPIKAAP